MFVRESLMVGGKTLTIETGRLAKQAHGATLVTYGESVVLVTAVVLGGQFIGPHVGVNASLLKWALGGVMIATVAQIGDLAE